MVPPDPPPTRASGEHPADELSDVLIGHGLRTLLISHVATLLALACVALYAVLPGAGVERDRILALAGVYAVCAVAIGLLPWPRLFRLGRADRLLRVWSTASLLLIGAALAVTGGSTSPLFLLYALAAVFFAAAYPLRIQLFFALASLGSYAGAVALGSGPADVNVVFVRASLFLIVAGLAANVSRELRRQLVAHIEARRELEVRAEELEQLAAENERLALHDALTGLANRVLFNERVERALATARRRGEQAAVLVVDLDDFKEVNDVLGHASGDALLRQIAPRLQETLRDEDTVARMGGDEFAVLLPEVADAEGAATVAAKLVRALEQPFALADVTIGIEASVGIALFPDHGEDGDELIRHADTAMYAAKEDRSGWTIYGGARDDLSPHRLALLGEIRTALETRQLVVHYQPMVDIRDGSLRGFEALVRWQHPERGLLPPGEFVPLVEQTSLIGPLTLEVLERALGECRRWRDGGLEIPVSVNVSVRSLHNERFPAEIAAVLARHGLGVSALVLELTESAIMTQPKRAAGVLEQLDRMGVQLVLDDFGTGYSSLVHLTRLPVSELKIDRAFVSNMRSDPNSLVIVRSMINIGRNLGLTVVAEGVEDEETWNRLSRFGCEVVQGYYLSEPLPAEELRPWLARAAWIRGAEAS